MAFSETRPWYFNLSKNDIFFHIEQTQFDVSVGCAGSSTVTKSQYTVDVSSGTLLCMVNKQGWKSMPVALTPLGNDFYTASMSGNFLRGDVVHTMFVASDNSKYFGTSFYVTDPPIQSAEIAAVVINTMRNRLAS